MTSVEIRSIVQLILVALVAVSPGCATRLAPPEIDGDRSDALTDQLADEGLQAIREYEARLRRVTDPLRLHSIDLCEDRIVPFVGLILEVQYPGWHTPLDRAKVRSGVDRKGLPTVVRVVPDSPASKAKMQRNDIVRRINDRRDDLPDYLNHRKGDQSDPTRIEFDRAGEKFEVTFAYLPACTPSVNLLPDEILSATNFRSEVGVYRGLVDFVRDDNELAILVAHEMAHGILEMRRGFNVMITGDKEIEMRADRIGLEIAIRAGYDIQGAAQIWERLVVARPAMISTYDGTRILYHGAVAERVMLMPNIIAELESKYSPDERAE